MRDRGAVSARPAQQCDGSGAAGRAGAGFELFRAQTSNRQYAAMAFPKQLYVRYHFGRIAEPADGALRIQRWHGTRAEERDAGGTETRPHQPASDRDFRVLRRGPQLRWAPLSMDAARHPADFTFVAATPTRGVFQTDGWGWNRIGFAYAAYTKEWGHGNHAADTRFFAIDYDDFRHILKTDNRPTRSRKAIRRTSTFRRGARTACTLSRRRRGRSTPWAGARCRRAAGERKPSVLTRSTSKPDISRRFCRAQAVDSRRLHDGFGRRQSERQQARDVFPDPADAPALRAIPVLQHDEHGGCLRSADSAAARKGDRYRANFIRCVSPSRTTYGIRAAERINRGRSVTPGAPPPAVVRWATYTTPAWNIGRTGI